MSDDLRPLYTIADLQQYLGLKSDRHILRSVSSWPHLTVAREVRFTAEHIDAILALHERGTTKAETPAFAGQRTRGSRT